MPESLALLWFNLDLRLAANSALERALSGGSAILPVFVWAPDEESPWSPGAASRWWLHQSLHELQAALVRRGSKLIVRRGPTAQALLSLARESGASSVFWNRRYEPAAIARELEVERQLRKHGLSPESCSGNVLFEPGTILNSSGKPFQVFGAFWRACLAREVVVHTMQPPPKLPHPTIWPESLPISELRLEPVFDWAEEIRRIWWPGERGAAIRLRRLSEGRMETYSKERDLPGHSATSLLSPHLHFGEISVRRVWHAALQSSRSEPFLRQLAWREFAHHLLFHFPQTGEQPLHPKFQTFPWRRHARLFKAWSGGRTGYPLVDAGMRELWHTGWMHNRVRMVAASFLVKHLMISWTQGAEWFWDTLVDADLANNTMGWQWSAGCGADAAPYFRIFNPTVQGEKFDPNGDYVRRWVPELAKLPAKWINQPWMAPSSVLSEAHVILGKDYPRPIVDHSTARKRALAALATIKEN